MDLIQFVRDKSGLVLLAAWFISILLLAVSVLMGVYEQSPTPGKLIAILWLAQLGSAIFFPITVGFLYEQLRREPDSSTTWWRDLKESGFLRIYKDRESSDAPDNAEKELTQAFQHLKEGHVEGDVKIIGVSLRVFFTPVSPFHNAVHGLLESKSFKGQLRALILSPDSPEADNRCQVEGRLRVGIRKEINLSREGLESLKDKHGDRIDFQEYIQAPYCTLVIFPDRCFFSPNILSEIVPVRLPMIVFRAGSHPYQVLSSYFDWVWGCPNGTAERPSLELEEEPAAATQIQTQ